MLKTELTPHGYMLVKLLKTFNLYLWAETREELEEELKALTEEGHNTKKMQIVPYYKNGNKAYVEIDNQLLRVA